MKCGLGGVYYSVKQTLPSAGVQIEVKEQVSKDEGSKMLVCKVKQTYI